MSARPAAPAKLTRPRLHDALARPRLYDLLDRAAEHPIVWICAPPGAGKTTLAAGYLDARRIRHLWYQVDAGDADPATFVHYLREGAGRLAGRKAASLPAYAADLQQNLPAFARGFFRAFFALLPRPCAWVLDNFHEARTTPELRAALAQGFEEIPEGVTLIVLSRSDPPPEFARLVANGRIARIDEAALRCTPEESASIVGATGVDRAHLARPAVQRLTRQCQGWVAALVLLREHLRREDAPLDEAVGEGRDAIFAYFASEIFVRARPQNQRALMLAALAPSVTAPEAVAITGYEDAPRLLDYLYRRHLFVDRRRAAETTWHYHALFREFLLDQAARRIPEGERRAAGIVAARRIAARGLAADALVLYRDAGEWDEMRALIRDHALEWARQGRAQVLSDWIEALPPAVRAADPWLDYWFGRAWIFVQPRRGAPALERAFDAFVAAGDVGGQAQALSALVTGVYYEWANFSALDRWLPHFERLLDAAAAPALDTRSELRLRAAHLIAMLFRRPDEHALEACARRLDDLLDHEPDVNVRMMAASTLFNYYNWSVKGDRAVTLVDRIDEVAARPEVTPHMRVWWCTHLSFWHSINGRPDEAARVAASARGIAEQWGLEAYLFEIDHAELSALIQKGELVPVQQRIDEVERRLSPTRRMDWAYFHRLKSLLEQRTGRHAGAVREAGRALALADETGLPALQLPHFHARLANAYSAAGDREAGLREMDVAVATASDADRPSLERQRAALIVDIAIARGAIDEARRRLAALLADHRARGQVAFLRNRPDLASRLAAFALDHGVEVETTRMLIERGGIAPPEGAGPNWPWRLRVRALGRFEIERDGHPIRFHGKAQQRPLDLLRLLVALGGVDVDAQQLAAALWPDADGAAAKASFDTTLFRLRKLLDVDGALDLSAGRLTLVRSLAWVDVRALESVLDDASSGGGRGGAASDAARRLLAAYTGPLLGDEASPWILKPRDALRARFVRTLSTVGVALESGGDFAGAADLYRRGLEAENLAEPLYRGLMRALAATGDRAEAMNAFRRCRELLSIVLGVAPSAETERLYREISGAAPTAADR